MAKRTRPIDDPFADESIDDRMAPMPVARFAVLVAACAVAGILVWLRLGPGPGPLDPGEVQRRFDVISRDEALRVTPPGATLEYVDPILCDDSVPQVVFAFAYVGYPEEITAFYRRHLLVSGWQWSREGDTYHRRVEDWEATVKVEASDPFFEHLDSGYELVVLVDPDAEPGSGCDAQSWRSPRRETTT
jgi:hypothetical protein